GPYEVYADGFMGLKAAYESMLMVVDHKRGERLKEIERNIEKLARIFPTPDDSRPALGHIAPMIVAHQIHASGDASQGIMASAFNLPNDPWIRGNVGWKQVMIYNVMKAKFDNCTTLIAKEILADGREPEFDPYFNFVLLHEVSHGLGPAYRKDGVSVASSIGALYTTVEEAKADVGALYLLLHLGGKYGIPLFRPDSLLSSYLAGLFRSIRFGVHEAHGGANVIQFNWFYENNVIKTESSGRFSIDPAELAKHTDNLLYRLCEIEASATEHEAEEFINRYAKAGGEIIDALARLDHIPVDINAGNTNYERLRLKNAG
ncbi:MAG: hypothetical protein HQK54_10895, partial [Oligoflexales bacterium]|nr:hypothetical protein [Oligoflexales bacterium]